MVTPDYFATLGIAMREGRDFTRQDDATRAPVMIVNDAFVRRFLAGRAAIGTRVHGWGRWFTIVGVAHDTKVHRLSEPARPYFYVPQAQVYRPSTATRSWRVVPATWNKRRRRCSVRWPAPIHRCRYTT